MKDLYSNLEHSFRFTAILSSLKTNILEKLKLVYNITTRNNTVYVHGEKIRENVFQFFKKFTFMALAYLHTYTILIERIYIYIYI